MSAHWGQSGPLDPTRRRRILGACGLALALCAGFALAASPTTSKTSAKTASKTPAKHAAPRPDSAAAHKSDSTATPKPRVPNFTGTWRLDPERSVFGDIPGGHPTSRRDVIAHDEPRVRQTLYLDNGGRLDTTVYVYRIDGSPSVNKVGGQDITATLAWDGDTLHIVSKTRLVIVEMTLDERWRLSAARDSLVMTRRLKYPMGEGSQRLVFVRQ
jgi:hypothetical protein